MKNECVEFVLCAIWMARKRILLYFVFNVGSIGDEWWKSCCWIALHNHHDDIVVPELIQNKHVYAIT